MKAVSLETALFVFALLPRARLRIKIVPMPIKIMTPLLVLLSAFGPAFAQSSRQQSPEAFAARFYRTYLRLKVNGLPDAKQFKALSPLLSPDLRQLFEDAKREQEKFIKENPDEKPPWIEGDLFTSLFEGAQSFKVGSSQARGEYREVPVRLQYRTGKEVTRWSDTLVLARTKTGWQVWDILLKGEWQFKQGGSLRDILKAR